MAMPGLNWSTAGADWPNREASLFVEASGIRWHVQRMGQGPVLLLIHGTGASTHSWRHLMPLLARRHHCIAIDLPGHAFTSAPPPWQLSLPGMAQSIAELLDELNVVPEVVVGPSAGAAIAALVLDTSPQGQESARRLAAEMGATYVALPHADAARLSQAVRAVADARVPA